ncbi:unnamed protein product [Larinioides sclopetarius]|uniref:BTB domain-containing protein n=1 Tax=Larinioides sclopetarius TaxID=280406 RepID=A0AAV2BRE0_9ARAC
MKETNSSETYLKTVNVSKRPLLNQKITLSLESPDGPLSTFKNDMKTLYNDHLFSDIVLRTDTEEFQAHRSILSARSPVFRSMFSTDMKEKADKCVEISDLSSDTVRRMLLFLYSDFVEELNLKSAKELYFAADKYDIISLKRRCAVFMQRNLCPSNVCEVLVLADMHQDRDLKSAVYDYIQKNDKKVFASDEWKLFMENNSYIAAHVMHNRYMKN